MPVAFEVQNVANIGGTRSEESSTNSRYGYFQPGVESLYVKDGSVRFVRLLPARDPSFSVNDPAYLTSFIPYRDASYIDKDTKLPAYTSWYLMVRGYKFAGRTGGSFLSPATLRSLGISEGTEDPLVDIRKLCKDNDNYKHLLDVKLGNGKKSKDLLPKLKFSPIINVLAFNERYQPEKVCVLEISGMAMEDLQRKLCMPRPAGQNPITPAWDKFMVGDPTDPMTGLVAKIKHGGVQGSTGMVSTALVSFSDSEYQLQGHNAYPIDPNTQTGQEILKSRYNLFSDKALKIWDYQEIVNWIIEDNTIPYELVQEACSYKANIPPRPAQAVTHSFGAAPGFQAPNTGAPAFAPHAPAFNAPGFQTPAAPAFSAPAAPAFGGAPAAPAFGGAPAAPAFGGAPAFSPAPAATDDDDVPMTFGGQVPPPANLGLPAAPVPPAAPVTPPAPAMPTPPPAPVVEEKFWIINGNQPVLTPKSAVKDYAAAGYSGPVMAENQVGGWKTLADFGLAPVVAAPAAPTPPPVAPTAPVAPTPPPAPAAQPVQAPVASSLPAPTGGGLTEEQRKRLTELQALVSASKASASEMTEYVNLMQVNFTK
jgi:hypothetical protein